MPLLTKNLRAQLPESSAELKKGVAHHLVNHVRKHLHESSEVQYVTQPFSEDFLVLTCLLSYLMTLVLLCQEGKDEFNKIIQENPGSELKEWEFEMVDIFKQKVLNGDLYRNIFRELDKVVDKYDSEERMPKFGDLLGGQNEHMFEIDLLFDIDGLSVEPTHLTSMDLTFHLKVPYPVRTYIDPKKTDEIKRLVSWIDELKSWLEAPNTKLPRPKSNYIPVYTS